MMKLKMKYATLSSFRLTMVWMACVVMLGPSSVVKADPPTSNSTSSSTPAAEESLDVRYARAQFDLAKLDLYRALEWNKRIPSLFSDRTIAYLQKNVDICKAQVKQTSAQQGPDVHEMYILGAEAAAELADADVQRKQQIYEQFPEFYHGIELDRAVAIAKLRKLGLERTVAKKGSVDTIAHLQWQVEELRSQLLELQIKVEERLPR